MMKIPSAVAVPARLVPPFLIAPFVSRIFFQVMRAHPGLFERLGRLCDKALSFSSFRHAVRFRDRAG